MEIESCSFINVLHDPTALIFLQKTSVQLTKAWEVKDTQIITISLRDKAIFRVYLVTGGHAEQLSRQKTGRLLHRNFR